MVKTLCRDCVFAEWDKDNQTGCSVGRLDKYKELECAFDCEEEGGDKKFFMIQGRYCMMCRNQKWVDDNDVSEEKWEEVAREEMKIKYQAIVFASDNKEEIKKTIKSLVSQKIPPVYIVLARKPNCKYGPRELAGTMGSNCKNIPWRIQNLLEAFVTDREALDIIVSTEPKPYFAVFYAGFEVPDDTFEQINKAITEDLIQFAVIAPNEDGNGMVMLSNVYRYYNGNKEKDLEEKIEEDECLENIIPISKICPNFPL